LVRAFAKVAEQSAMPDARRRAIPPLRATANRPLQFAAS